LWHSNVRKLTALLYNNVMKTPRIILTSFLCFLLTLAGCSKSAPKPAAEPSASPQQPAEGKRIASVDVVKATPQPLVVSAGTSGEATVHLTIQSGYHVNANPPTYSYLKATELEIAPGDGISVGQVKYPAALNKKFLFAEKPLAVYEGETDLKAEITADKSAKPGEKSLSAKLRIQACDDQVCYPPGTLNLSIPVSIK
jgi:thiol:disulfide interchange protein DsbD